MVTYPEMCMAVNYHGPFDELVWALQERVARHHAGIIDQQVDFAHLTAHFLRCGVHALPLAHVTRVGVHLRLERWDLFYATNSSCEKTNRDIRGSRYIYTQ